jgi:hypothetical protein
MGQANTLNGGTPPQFIEKSVYEGQTYHNGVAGAANNPFISSTFLAQWLLVLTLLHATHPLSSR